MFQNNRTSFSDHLHGSEKQSFAVWTSCRISEQQNSPLLTISMVQRNRAPPSEQVSLNSPPAFRLVLGENTGLFGLGLERSLRDQARRHFALATSYSGQSTARLNKTSVFWQYQSGSGGQFGLAKFALWRDSTSPGQAVCSYWRTSASCSNVQFWSQGNRWNRVIVIVPVLKLNPWRLVLWAEPVLLQRMTSSRQGKPEKESSVQRKANWFKDRKSAFL